MLDFLRKRFRKHSASLEAIGLTQQAALAGQQEAEANRRKTEEHFQQLVAEVRDYAIFLLDLEGRILSWNAGAEHIKGYTAAEIIGQHFSRFYPPEAVAAGWPAHELNVAATAGRFEDEGWRVRKDGSRFWANVIITAARNEAGQVRGFLKITRDLTERKLAEENARRLLQEEAARRAAEASAREAQRAQREERYQREQLQVTLASIGDAVIVTDTHGAVTFLNPAAQALTGWGSQEAAGQPLEKVFRILNEETRQPVENPVHKVLRQGVTVGLANHTVLIARDGREVPIDDSGAPIRGEEGTVAGVVLVFRDVTEAREVARAVQQSEARNAAILKTALDCIITMDDQGRIVEFNPAAEETFGYRRDEILGRPLAELIIPPSRRERHNRGLAHYLATGEGPILNRRLELLALRADGTEFPVELTITRIPTEEPPMFTAFLRDLSERKRTEHRRTARLAITQILAEAATVDAAAPRILQAACESLGWDVGTFWVVDPQAQVLRCVEIWHPAALQATAFAEASRQMPFVPGIGLPGRVWASARPVWIPDVKEDTNFPRGPIALQVGLRGAFGFPMLLGKEVLGVLEFFSHEVREPDDELLEMVATVGSQIGLFMARRRADDQLRRRNEELAAAARQKDEFLAMLAHELRNPLAPIRNALYVMKMPGATGAAVEQARQMTERQVQHLVRLVDDLLDVSRIMRGRIELRKDLVELAPVIAQAIETAQPMIDAQGQELVISLPPEPIRLEADPIRLAQIVGNLLHNAAKFSGHAGRVWLTAERQGTEVIVRIRDEGMGIRADLLPHIFDLFVQGDRSLERSPGGLGIGLTVVRKLVAMHGGTVTAASEGPGKGSEFVVCLPGLPGITEPGPARASLASRPLLASCRALVVDDNVDAAESVAMLLRLWGHDVRLAHNGPEALQVVQAYQPDVIVLDIGLPGMNGYEVARHLRQQPQFATTLLVAVTGYGQEEDHRRSEDAGFDRHLTKPVDPDKLQGLLAGLGGQTKSSP
jgi:PAS domain S-box-containing protein